MTKGMQVQYTGWAVGFGGLVVVFTGATLIGFIVLPRLIRP